MVKHNTPAIRRNIQSMPMFSDDEFGGSDLPLPLVIASNEGFALFYHVQDGVYFYAVQDWVRGVAQLSDGTASAEFWRAIKRRLDKAKIETRTWCTRLPYKATDGKTYQRDFATAEGLYTVTQRMDASTGIRNKILAYLVKAGVKMDEYRLDPEQAISDGVDAIRQKGGNEWADTRLSGIYDRKYFTRVLVECVRELHPGNATNMVYRDLFGLDASGLRTRLDIQPKANPRDHMHRIALNYTSLAESVIATFIEQASGDSLQVTPKQAIEIIHKIAQPLGLQAQELSAMLGIDIVSGKPLLGSGQ